MKSRCLKKYNYQNRKQTKKLNRKTQKGGAVILIHILRRDFNFSMTLIAW